MSSLPAIKWDKVATVFPIISLWGYFLDVQGQITPVGGPIWPKFELVRDIMHVLVTYKFKMDLINEKVANRFFAQGQVSSGIWPKFELIQALMYVLVTCKYEKDRNKNSRENMETRFSPLCGDFFWYSRAANSVVCGRIWPNFELIHALIYVIVTCKYEKDPIKNSRENEATPFSPL